MAKNHLHFQKALSLADFLTQYVTDEQCRNALSEWRRPHGVVCP